MDARLLFSAHCRDWCTVSETRLGEGIKDLSCALPKTSSVHKVGLPAFAEPQNRVSFGRMQPRDIMCLEIGLRIFVCTTKLNNVLPYWPRHKDLPKFA